MRTTAQLYETLQTLGTQSTAPRSGSALVLVLMMFAACASQPDAASVIDTQTSDAESTDVGLADTAVADSVGVDGAQQDTAQQDIVTATDVPDTSLPDVALQDATTVDAMTQDTSFTDLTPQDTGPSDANDWDTGPACTTGTTECFQGKVATCNAAQSGWTMAKCGDGHTCDAGACKPARNNLIVLIDTSGSMQTVVQGCTAAGQTWPTCAPSKSCSRVALVKQALSTALKSPIADRLAMFRLPQVTTTKLGSDPCRIGYYTPVKTAPGSQSKSESAKLSDPWFEAALNTTLCVPFPSDGVASGQKAMLTWMDGTEALQESGTCSNTDVGCMTVAGCAGACCGGKCFVHSDPELRSTGGTPIGETLFYMGEYIRNKVIVDGKFCMKDADCGNPNYGCWNGPGSPAGTGKCRDFARTCRKTVVLVVSDAGQASSNSYFGPWTQAKRMAYGLCCSSDADCVGGSKSVPTVCKAGHCLPASTPTGHVCNLDMKPCLPSGQKGEATYCAGLCAKDPLPSLTGCAKQKNANVLRAPSGAPFGVTLRVLDTFGAKSSKHAIGLAVAGGGKLHIASPTVPGDLLKALLAAMDVKAEGTCSQ